MLIDLLAQDNYVNYNVIVANKLGLTTAIYLSEITNINDKAIRKNKIQNNAFVIDRNYLTYRTCLSIEEQLKIEKELVQLGIINKNEDVDSIELNINRLTSIMMCEDIEINDVIDNIVKAKKKVDETTKRAIICNSLKKFIECDNQELKEAYYGWIEGVYANPKGFLSKRSIKIFQEAIDNFSQRNLDVALKVIEIATIYGYRLADYAIDIYNKQYKPNFVVTSNTEANSVNDLSKEIF